MNSSRNFDTSPARVINSEENGPLVPVPASDFSFLVGFVSFHISHENLLRKTS
jgi:hypothetical protein